MAFSLSTRPVANYVQILGAVGAFLEKSPTHFPRQGWSIPAIRVEPNSHRTCSVPFPDCLGRTPFARCNGGSKKRHVGRFVVRVNRASTMPHFRHW